MFGAVVLLILSDIQDLEAILHKIEWGTLLFFGGLFVLMEGLGELGLIRFIGDVMILIVEVSYLLQRYNIVNVLVIMCPFRSMAACSCKVPDVSCNRYSAVDISASFLIY